MTVETPVDSTLDGIADNLAGPPRVLIATADAVLCFGLRPVLNAEGYGVSCVGADSDAVLTRVAAFRPHLILIDVAEPGGWEQDVLGRLRADNRHLLTGIVILAAANDPRQVTRHALAAGADDVIFKPCDRDLLVTRLISTLRAKALLREREMQLRHVLRELARAHEAEAHLRTLWEQATGLPPSSPLPAAPAPVPGTPDEPGA